MGGAATCLVGIMCKHDIREVSYDLAMEGTCSCHSMLSSLMFINKFDHRELA